MIENLRTFETVQEGIAWALAHLPKDELGTCEACQEVRLVTDWTDGSGAVCDPCHVQCVAAHAEFEVWLEEHPDFEQGPVKG